MINDQTSIKDLQLNFDPFPEIQTERLILRRVMLSDADELFFLRSDKTVLEYLDKEPAKNIEEVNEFIEKLFLLESNNEAINWTITLKDDDQMLGTLCFWNIAREHHRAELGYVLHPDQQGKGIMQEAMEAVINYGFKTMNLHSIEANVNPHNKKSIKLLEKNKFIREAYFKENFLFRNKFIDTAIYSLLNPESTNNG